MAPAKDGSTAGGAAAIRQLTLDDMDACEQALRADGAVCLKGLFDAEMIAQLTREHDQVLANLDAKMVGLERKEATYLNGFDKTGKKVYQKQGYWDLAGGTKVLDVGTGRLDFTYGLDEGIFVDPKFHAPPAISELFQRVLKSDYTHSCGAVPSRSRSDNGFLHRDTYSFFDDETLDKSVPPFYFTVLMPLNDITQELGPTEIHLGSHRCGMKDALACPTASACPLKAGDALVFDGRCLHRGLANATSDLRRVLYAVWHKKWYLDYSEFDFAQDFSVCDEPAAKRAKTTDLDGKSPPCELS
jgi:hypothetical protein